MLAFSPLTIPMGRRGIKIAFERSEEALKRGPREPQENAKGSQEHLKRAPRGPQETSKGLQATLRKLSAALRNPKRPQDPRRITREAAETAPGTP